MLQNTPLNLLAVVSCILLEKNLRVVRTSSKQAGERVKVTL